MIYNAKEIEYNKYTEQLKALNKDCSPTCAVVTFGCQQNEADSEKIAGILSDAGYRLIADSELADVVIFNTCAVREHAELKALSIIGKLKARKLENPELIIGVCGCMAAINTTVEKIKKSYHFISFTLEPNMLHKLPELIYNQRTLAKRSFSLGNDCGDIVEGLPVIRAHGHRAWVSIMYGCNNFCSYCIVPYTRGRERSRDADDIVRECEILAKNGVNEITLLGQNVNSYSHNCDFSTLLARIAEIPGDFIIRFMTSHPKDVSDSLVSVMAKYSPKIAPFFHLPLQSGSDRILGLMNRKYTREKYLRTVEKLRSAMPGIALSTDIIVGFPSESDEDFAETLDIIKQLEYDNVYSFIYSPRVGTPAAKMQEQIPREITAARMSQLLEISGNTAYKNNLSYVGNVYRVLIDSSTQKEYGFILNGRTDTNKLVHIKSEQSLKPGFRNVLIEEAKPYDLIGKII